MSREIKFNFIYSDGKYFGNCVATLDEIVNGIEDDLYEKATEQYLYYSNLENFELVVKREYAGIEDKNGVEVYEGDIVKARGTKKGSYFVSEVVFQRQGFQLKENKTKFVDSASLVGVEVLGNIYENPELLEVV